MTASCGIDFGTSNSAVAVAAARAVELAAVEGRHVTIPSALFYPAGAASPAPLFGRAAQAAFVAGDDGRFMRSLKRILGTALMGATTAVNGRGRHFSDILRDFIAHLRDTAATRAGVQLDHVVMGRPVHFVDGDPAADARAQDELGRIARAAGFSHVSFQFEPIAAAFAHEQKLPAETVALVADIGGGTSDFTVIRLSPARKLRADRAQDILSNTGVRVGGNDVDRDLCLAAFMPLLGSGTTYGDKRLPVPAAPFCEMAEWAKVNFLYTPKMRAQVDAMLAQSHARATFGRFSKVLHDESGHRLLSAVEAAKIDLTAHDAATAPLDFIAHGLAAPVTRAGFDAAVADRIDGISAAVTECLAQSGLGADAVDLVILTGGTTEIPAVRRAILKHFPAAAVSEDGKLSSVGLGLGYDAARRFA